jgi:hypothetical protein
MPTARLTATVITTRRAPKGRKRRRKEKVWKAFAAPALAGKMKCRKRHGVMVAVWIRGEVCDESFASPRLAHAEIGRRVKRRVKAALAVIPLVYNDFRLSPKFSVKVQAEPTVKPLKKYKGKGDYEN